MSTSKFLPVISMSTNASGALAAAERGDVVAIVDVIDMSTTLEAALDEEAAEIYGAAPDSISVPVPVDPERIGREAGRKAAKNESGVIIISEPRVGFKEEREQNCSSVIRGIKDEGAKVVDILPNIGAETVNLTDFRDKVVVAVTNSGGVSFDTAYNRGTKVFTATIARTLKKKGEASVEEAAKRICSYAEYYHKNITMIAASGNSLEDVLAAQYITNFIINSGFLGS